MLIVVCPAKALDFESPLATRRYTVPDQLERTKELVGILRRSSRRDLLAPDVDLPCAGRAQLRTVPGLDASIHAGQRPPAVLAFNGDTYQGLAAGRQFNARDFTHAQKVLRILSGLHGVLRPLDLIQPYRLEMGSKYTSRRRGPLRLTWGDTVTERLQADLAGSPRAERAREHRVEGVLRGGAAGPARSAGVVSPVFLDAKGDGEPKIVSFFAKRARGAMAGWIVRGRISSVKALERFDLDGYRFDPARSTRDEPVFIRHGA